MLTMSVNLSALTLNQVSGSKVFFEVYIYILQIFHYVALGLLMTNGSVFFIKRLELESCIYSTLFLRTSKLHIYKICFK